MTVFASDRDRVFAFVHYQYCGLHQVRSLVNVDVKIRFCKTRVKLIPWRAKGMQVFTLPLYLIDEMRSVISKEHQTVK
jgi:hypothetical protein